MPNPNRTALLIRCSVEEAELIRETARKERRTVSSFVLNCVENKLKIHAAVQEQLKAAATLRREQASRPNRFLG